MATLIDGKAIAGEILSRVHAQVQDMEATPGLAAILVGDDEASHIYVRLKERRAKKVGIHFERVHLPADTTQDALAETIQELNSRTDIHAVLLQLPLPDQLDEDATIALIDPRKDVDGFHPDNVTRYLRSQDAIEPVLTRAVLALILASGEDLTGKHAMVVANNPSVFAPPILKALDAYQVTTDWAKRDDADITERILDADILIVALGTPHYITKDLVKPGAIVIDIGTNKVDGKLLGDVDPAVDDVAAYRTPVPGGVGPVTVACLLENVLACYQKQNG